MSKENPKLIEIGSAIRAVAAGKKITKKEWNDEGIYGFLGNGQLCIRKPGEAEDDFHPWLVNDGDLLGKDWYVLD